MTLARLGGGKFDAGTQTHHEAPRAADRAFQEATVAGGDCALVHEPPPDSNVHPAFPNTPLTQRVFQDPPPDKGGIHRQPGNFDQIARSTKSGIFR